MSQGTSHRYQLPNSMTTCELGNRRWHSFDRRVSWATRKTGQQLKKSSIELEKSVGCYHGDRGRQQRLPLNQDKQLTSDTLYSHLGRGRAWEQWTLVEAFAATNENGVFNILVAELWAGRSRDMDNNFFRSLRRFGKIDIKRFYLNFSLKNILAECLKWWNSWFEWFRPIFFLQSPLQRHSSNPIWSLQGVVSMKIDISWWRWDDVMFEAVLIMRGCER